jgi:hypothetical protein
MCFDAIVTDIIIIIIVTPSFRMSCPWVTVRPCPKGSVHTSFLKLHSEFSATLTSSPRCVLFPDWSSLLVPRWSAYQGCHLDAFEMNSISLQLLLLLLFGYIWKRHCLLWGHFLCKGKWLDWLLFSVSFILCIWVMFRLFLNINSWFLSHV